MTEFGQITSLDQIKKDPAEAKSLLFGWKEKLSCFAPSYTDQAQQARTEEPCSGWRWHGCNITIVNSPSAHRVAICCNPLSAAEKAKIPMLTRWRVVLRA
jgi:hypothetical protein